MYDRPFLLSVSCTNLPTSASFGATLYRPCSLCLLCDGPAVATPNLGSSLQNETLPASPGDASGSWIQNSQTTLLG